MSPAPVGIPGSEDELSDAALDRAVAVLLQAIPPESETGRRDQDAKVAS